MKIRILRINESLFDTGWLKYFGLVSGIEADNESEVLVQVERPEQAVLEFFLSSPSQKIPSLKIFRADGDQIIFALNRKDIPGGNDLQSSGISDDRQNLFAEISLRVDHWLSPPFLSDANYGLDFSVPQIMGILNVTPDSFSDGGHFLEKERAVKQALAMEKAGAAIIDIGGESSRPGADPVDLAEELKRVIPVIEGIRNKSDVLISIDTVKSGVAEQALQAGANWINDISGLRADQNMTAVAKTFQCPVVVMHMQGTPETMQLKPEYENVCLEVGDFFEERIQTLESAGISKLILDPGIGFGKRLEDNLDLIRCSGFFRQHGYPLLIGISRKSFIGGLTGKEADQRLPGSLAALLLPIQAGVNIVRVHDVDETRDMITILNRLRNA